MGNSVSASDDSKVTTPTYLYYALIDGTEALDSVAFGQQIEAMGWKNLLSEYLKKDDGGTRLVDPAHPFLPICLFGKIAVVSPNGRNGMGIDDFWKAYSGELPEEKPDGSKTWTDTLTDAYTTKGRRTAAEKSAEFMSRFILRPAAVLMDNKGTINGLADGWDDPTAVAAELLYVSSHGWLGGFMRGAWMWEAKGFQPDEAVPAFGQLRAYFLVGAVDKSGGGFAGPKWIVLGQCSTVNTATWPMWARIFARSNPSVRGVLAYSESAPDATNAVNNLASFFGHLRNGDSFLKAWIQANAGINWAAIIHKEAVDDTLLGWQSFKPLSSASVEEGKATYLGYDTANVDGVLITDVDPPFGLKIEGDTSTPHDGFREVLPETLSYGRAAIRPAGLYRATVATSQGETIVSVAMTLVHIRRSYGKQIAWNALFTTPTLETPPGEKEGVSVSVANTVINVSAVAGATPKSFTLGWTALDKGAIDGSGASQDHSYFWFHIELTTTGGTLKHDFTTKGLRY